MATDDYSKYKCKNILINYEDLHEDIDYAFTFNPCDKIQHWKMADRLIGFHKELQRIFMYRCMEYKLYPEISKSGRLHLHGYIRITDKDDFYIHAIRHMVSLGTVAITPIKSVSTIVDQKDTEKYKSWHEYCTKQHTFHDKYKLMTFSQVPIISKGYVTDK